MSARKNLKTYSIRTFGCQMNEHDSTRIAQQLDLLGLVPAASDHDADLVIINSCCVRAKPEHKALSEAGRYQRSRKRYGARVVIAGCVAQQYGADLLNKFDFIDGIIGPDAICRLEKIVARLEEKDSAVVDVVQHRADNPAFVPVTDRPSAEVSSLVTIMKGCNNFCSYCVVPYVRGREVSRSRDDILKEIDLLASSGCREVVLLGQNVNSYRDQAGTGFATLLTDIDRQAAIDRIRFTTSHPKDLSEELIEAMASLGRVCEHIHLGLQSGSGRVLRSMNRGYSPEIFVKNADAIRAAVPGVSITTDIIVGFPGETDDDFAATLDVVSEVQFDQAFCFKYSPRAGTAAARLENNVPEEVKSVRLAKLHELLGRLEKKSLGRLVGKKLEVLVESRSLRNEKSLCGRSRCNRVINFDPGENTGIGTMAEIEINEVRGHTLWGNESP